MTICVFGGADQHVDEAYFALAEELGRALARRGHSLIFGGGGSGMMGAVARGAASGGAHITGVAPRFFDKPGVFSPLCSDFILTDTMAQRKTVMESRGDAFIALPGGIGTFEEIYEVITLSQLGQLCKPIAFLDTLGYWDEAAALVEKAVSCGFTRRNVRERFGRFTDVEKCLNYCEGKILP